MTGRKHLAALWGALLMGAAGLLSTEARAAPERVALLIGNADYNKNGQIDTAAPPLGTLTDLPNACKDVEAIEAKLILLGWSEDEITKECDQEKPGIVGHLDQFIAKFNGMQKPIGFIYFSGHGIQVNEVGYVFGVKASIDVKLAAETMETKPKNQLFPVSGIDIARYLKSGVGDVYDGALVIVLDACRDNPVAAVLRNNRKSIPVTAPKTSDNMMGMVIAYSTTAGAYASDGLGELSPYAEALRDSMREDLSIEEALSKAAFALYKKTEGTANEQQPSKEGYFPPPPPRRCFAAGCGGTGPPAASGSGAAATIETIYRQSRGEAPIRLAMAGPVPHWLAKDHGASPIAAARTPPGGAVPSRAVPERTEVFRASRAIAADLNVVQAVDNRILVDVYYCSGYEMSEGLKTLAQTAAERIRAYANGPEGQLLIKSIRFREHPKTYNELQGSRFVRNLIVFDNSSVQEEKLGQSLATVVGKPFAPIRNLDYSAGYLKIYACEGASPNATASRVFFHVADMGTYPLARNVMQEMSQRFPGINIAGGIEVLPRQSPRTSEVRYFHREDAVLANDIATQITRSWGVPTEAKYLPGYKVSQMTMEVWLGRLVKGCDPNAKVVDATGCKFLPPPPA